MAELKYEIVENLGILSVNPKGWRKELNLVSWNEREAKFDLREWNEEHTRMSKGITFTSEEARVLYEILKEEFEGK
ncbi:MAG: PC4/YdbC family ssDNA-binding protein [Tissierellia bacterium]|nr:PC4/YdbC family ssDNA-binding protein [Tissierellia bacterium]